MTVCICLNYIGGGTLGPTIELTCNPSGVIINQPTSLLLPPTCPLCLTVPSGTTSITAYDPVTNCTEVINVTPVPNIPCSFGMDVVFSIDYTGSMGGVIDKIKQEVSTLTNSIVTLSNNNYRLGLVIFDEFNQNLNQPVGSGLAYYSQIGYQSLPVQQRYINSGVPLSQAITAFEILSPNNQSSFITKLSSLNQGSAARLTRLNQNGILQGSVPYINNSVTDVKYQIDGKILAVGNFTNPLGRIVRINPSGILDPSFITSTGFNNPVNSFDINSIGQIIVGGTFTTYQGISRNRVALLNTNGSLDLGFSVGTGFDNQVQKVKFQSDGKILVGGNFLTYNGSSANRICRLNTDGTLDGTFNIGTGLGNTARTIEVQSDGKILVGGDFVLYNGTTTNFICRLNTDGTLDGTFNIGTGFSNTVIFIKIQPDGKILVGGNFSSYNGSPVNRICRLNTDGTLDGTFTIGGGFNNIVNSIDIQSDGKIIVGGAFTIYNGLTLVNRICRLNTNGTLDTSFGCTPVEGANNTVISVAVDGLDNVCVAGNFTQGVNKNCSSGIVLGGGIGGPEPSDMSIDRIVNYNLTGNFNPLNSKTIILITDAPPGGNDDFFDNLDTNFINNVLIPSCVSGNIRVLVVLPIGATNPGSTNYLPLVNLANLTGGQVFTTSFDSNFNVNGVATALSNLC
jgi:uncharacterized delta-60 repeat protein